MRITETQRQHIDALFCERLSSNDENFRLVDDFFNSRNISISDTLQNEAYQEDETGVVAYYVVKNVQGQILVTEGSGTCVTFFILSVRRDAEILMFN